MGDAPEAASFSSLIYYLNLDLDELEADIDTKKITPILDRLGDDFFKSINMTLMEAVLEELEDQNTLDKLNAIKESH